MASTIQLQRTITYASSFVRYAPLTMSSDDPALSNADWVRQFILSAPFAWRWNRTVTQIQCAAGKSDYSVALPNFGWVEKAVNVDPANGYSSTELEVAVNLVPDTLPNLPAKISAQLDDGAGNITFRVFPAPDSAYIVHVTSQNAAPIFAETTDTWAPIPDFMSYIVTQGFLAKTYEYMGDPRFQSAMQLFLQFVVSANEGLSDSQRNIFLADRINTTREQLKLQQGKQ
jgi:hypothetical protein